MIRSAFVAVLAMAGILQAQIQPAPAAESKQKAAFVTKAEIYPLTTCVVSGEDLDDEAVTFTVEGRTFKTCCEKCQKKIEKDVATYAKKLDEALIKAQVGHYPLEACVISGKKLGSMGDPVQLVLDGTLVQLCCESCTKKATAAAPAMAQKVREAAYAAQLKTYPLKTCVVSGEELGDDAVSAMFGTTLVRFCCEKCIAKFEKEPQKFMAGLGHGKKEKGTPPAKKPAGKGEQGKDGMDGECCESETGTTGGCRCSGGADAPKATPVPAPKPGK